MLSSERWIGVWDSPRQRYGTTMCMWLRHCLRPFLHQLWMLTGWLASTTLVIWSSGYTYAQNIINVWTRSHIVRGIFVSKILPSFTYSAPSLTKFVFFHTQHLHHCSVSWCCFSLADSVVSTSAFLPAMHDICLCTKFWVDVSSLCKYLSPHSFSRHLLFCFSSPLFKPLWMQMMIL